MIDMFQGRGSPVTTTGFASVAAKLGIAKDPASLWSILSVESRGFGYLPDKHLKILFERHVFHARTGGRFSADHPDISNPEPGGYSYGAAEYDRIKRAIALDRKAALESASWGLAQVMGFNAEAIGYASVDAMIEAFKDGEDAQLDGCARYIDAHPALRSALAAHDWARVAFFYNGKDYAKSSYDTNLEDAYVKYTDELPDVDVRAGQARLAYLGFTANGIDGVVGNATRTAILAFQQRYKLTYKLTENSTFDNETKAALKKEAGV